MKLACRCGYVHRRDADTTYVVTAAADAGRVHEIEREVRDADDATRRVLMRELAAITSLLLVCPECNNLIWCRPEGRCGVYRYLGDQS